MQEASFHPYPSYFLIKVRLSIIMDNFWARNKHNNFNVKIKIHPRDPNPTILASPLQLQHKL